MMDRQEGVAGRDEAQVETPEKRRRPLFKNDQIGALQCRRVGYPSVLLMTLLMNSNEHCKHMAQFVILYRKRLHPPMTEMYSITFIRKCPTVVKAPLQ